MSLPSRWLAIAGGTIGLVGSMASHGCLIDDPNHCANNDEPCQNDQVCDPCTPTSQAAGGCVDASDAIDRDPETPGCQLVGGGGTETTGPDPGTSSTGEPVTTTLVDSSSGSSSGDTMPPIPDCEEPDGMLGAGCDPATPFCVGQTCVPCTDPGADCAAVDADGDVCDAASGQCVLCTAEDDSACVDTTPICVGQTCLPCTEHDQCEGDAGCHLYEGSCLPSDQVFYASANAAGCSDAMGTKGTPTCSLTAAINLATAVPEATVRVAPGTYNEAVNIGGGGVLAIIGESEPTIRSNSSGPPTFTVFSTVYFAGLNISGNTDMATSDGISASNDVWVDDSRLAFNSGLGIESTGGQLKVRRSRVLVNSQGGIRGSGQSVSLENTIIAANGNVGSSVSGVTTQGLATLDMLYVTIAANQGGLVADGFVCVPGTGATVRNSIVVSSMDNTIGCAPADVDMTYTATNDPAFSGGPTNVAVVTDDLDFVNPGVNDFRIQATSAAMDVALWVDEDPLTDWNLDDRPGVDGAMDYAGADVPD